MFNTIEMFNTPLCLIILVLGVWGFLKNRQSLPLLIGLAFGLFAVSHIVALMGYETQWGEAMIIIRFAAYALVTYSMFRMVFCRLECKNGD